MSSVLIESRECGVKEQRDLLDIGMLFEGAFPKRCNYYETPSSILTAAPRSNSLPLQR